MSAIKIDDENGLQKPKTQFSTANPTWGDIFECCFKAQSSKLERLFSLKGYKRDSQALSFELSKMSPQVGFAVLKHMIKQWSQNEEC